MSRTGTSLSTKTAKHRFRYGEMNEVVVPVTTVKTNGSTQIAAGDMIILSTAGNTPLSMTAGVAYPASYANFASLDQAADYFLGIALDSSADGDSDDIAVATSGVFEFDCASSTTVVGQAANMTASQEAGASCDCYTVTVGAGLFTNSNRIGTVVSKGTSQTSVLVRIQSAVFGPGVFET